MTLLRTSLPQRLRAVALDLALRDGPRLADEPSAQLPAMDLNAQRGSRHPETGSGFGQGEHLGLEAQEHGPLAAEITDLVAIDAVTAEHRLGDPSDHPAQRTGLLERDFALLVRGGTFGVDLRPVRHFELPLWCVPVTYALSCTLSSHLIP